METVKEMATSREPSEEVSSSRMACRDITLVVVDVVAIPVEVIIASREILEGCNQACQVASAMEAEVASAMEAEVVSAMEAEVASTEEAEVAEECTKVEATTKPKVSKTSKAISKIRTTTIRPSNANSLKAAEIVLTGISVPLLTGSLNCR